MGPKQFSRTHTIGQVTPLIWPIVPGGRSRLLHHQDGHNRRGPIGSSRWNHPTATIRWKGQWREFRGVPEQVNETRQESTPVVKRRQFDLFGRFLPLGDSIIFHGHEETIPRRPLGAIWGSIADLSEGHQLCLQAEPVLPDPETEETA